MYRIIGRIVAVALVLCLLITGAAAELSWVDDQLALLPGSGADTAFSLGVHIDQLYPFGKETLEMLNGALEHIRVQSRICPDGVGMGIAVDGETLLTVQETAQDNRIQLVTSLLPNRVLVADASPMDVLSSNQMAQQQLFDLHAAIGEAEACWPSLADAIVPFAEEKKANYKIDRIGYARWVRIAKLSAEDSAALLPQIVAMLGCGMDNAFRESLAALTCGDGFTVALYSDKENGTPMALYMKGTVYLREEEKWSLAYQWATAGDDTQRKDTYRCELAQSKSPRHKRVAEAERTLTGEEGKITQSRKSKLIVKDDVLNQTISQKDSLTTVGDGSRVEITGKLETTVKDQSGKDTVTTVTTLQPELALEGGVLSGTAALTQVQGKAELRGLVFTFDPEPAVSLPAAETAAADASTVPVSSLDQNTHVLREDGADSGYLVGSPPIGITACTAPAEPVVVDLDTAEPAHVAALLDEMTQNAAGALLIALAKLPGEPLALLTDLMTETDYQTFLSLLGDL